MANNSIRERIISGIETSLNTLSSVKTVERVLPSDVSALNNYAATQLPLAVVIGGVPDPDPHVVGRSPGGVDVVLSMLKVDIYVYYIARVDTADTLLSSLLDDVWVLLYSDQTREGLAIQTKIKPEMEVMSWEPYMAFKITAEIKYKHSIGGI